MSTAGSRRVNAVVIAVAVAAVAILLMRQDHVAAQREDMPATAGPRYTVNDTEGHNLIVTDNKTNTLYFYTIDKDQEVGSELKLRGSIDLNQVGKASIQPKKGRS